MSFWSDLKKIMREHLKNNPNKSYSLDEELVIYRDYQVKEKQYSKLNSFIIDNWESGNCVDFIVPYVNQLIINKENRYYKQIWKAVIKTNLRKFWDYLDLLKEDYPKVLWEDLHKIDTSKFNEHLSDYKDKKLVVAYFGNYTIKAIELYKQGLETLNEIEEINYIDSVIQNIHKLNKPKNKITKTTDKRKLDETVFWELIETSRNESNDKYDFIEILKEKLILFKTSEIKNFQKQFLTFFDKLNFWDYWAVAYIIRKGCGDDEFDYFRAWVISKGKATYSALINNKYKSFKELLAFEDPQFEDFLYVAEDVYEIKSNKIMKQPNIKPKKIGGTQWEEDSICQDFPNCCKIFEYKI